MEYIQCPNCLKKYGVNEKIRAASGKTIHCKGCQESFEIAIYSTPEPEKPATEASETSQEKENRAPETETPGTTSDQPATKKKSKKAKKPAKRRSFQKIYTIVLGILLVSSLVAALIFQFKPDLFDTAPVIQPQLKATEKPQVVKSKPPVTTPDTAPQEQASEETTEEDASDGSETSSQATVSKASSQDPVDASDDCKQAATEQWFTDYMMTHGNISGKEYIRMLDESSSHTERIRILCKDKYLASRITEAAIAGDKPAWIEVEINERTGTEYDGSAQKSRW